MKYRIYENENDLLNIEHVVKKLNSKIVDHNSTNKVLSEKFECGKKLTVTVIKVMINKIFHKAFLKWKLNTQKIRIADMQRIVRDKMINLERLERIYTELEIQNENLLSENEDLRHSSLDGLEIANVILISTVDNTIVYTRKGTTKYRPTR